MTRRPTRAVREAAAMLCQLGASNAKLGVTQVGVTDMRVWSLALGAMLETRDGGARRELLWAESEALLRCGWVP